MTVTRQPLLLWQIPELEQSSTALPLPAVSTPVGDDATTTVAVLPAADETDAGSCDDPTADPTEQGYADGWERGLLQGRERGYEEGIAAAAEAAQAAVRDQVRHLEAIIARLNAPIAALDAAIEEGVAALALEVARCVIGSETSRSRDYLVRLIREAVAKVPIELGMLQIVLNPVDQNVIRELAPELEEGNAVLIGDESIEPGDCLVIADGDGTPHKDMRWRPRRGTSQVDLSLAARWRDVMHALFEGEDK
jgi:flagellar assembly protein FliH